MSQFFSNSYKYLFLVAMLFLWSCGGGAKEEASQDTAVEESADSPVGNQEEASVSNQKRILFFGNSLTAGYGLEPSQAFPALIQQKIDSIGASYEVVNAGLSGETTAGGANRIEWVLRQPIDIMVLELGGNDGLRGISTEESYANLQSIIDQTTKKYPRVKILLAGMQVPPNMGQDYATAFQEIYPTLAEKNELPLIPFLLLHVGGEKDLNLPDGIHPNIEGHKIVAETVWKSLQPLL